MYLSSLSARVCLATLLCMLGVVSTVTDPRSPARHVILEFLELSEFLEASHPPHSVLLFCAAHRTDRKLWVSRKVLAVFVVLGWSLGIVEAISIAILLGSTVDHPPSSSWTLDLGPGSGSICLLRHFPMKAS